MQRVQLLVQTSLGTKQQHPFACISGEMKPLGCENGLGCTVGGSLWVGGGRR